jgi:hypothetical protein
MVGDVGNNSAGGTAEAEGRADFGLLRAVIRDWSLTAGAEKLGTGGVVQSGENPSALVEAVEVVSQIHDEP